MYYDSVASLCLQFNISFPVQPNFPLHIQGHPSNRGDTSAAEAHETGHMAAPARPRDAQRESATQLLQVMELLIEQLHALQIDNVRLLDSKLRLESLLPLHSTQVSALIARKNCAIFCTSLSQKRPTTYTTVCGGPLPKGWLDLPKILGC